MTCEAGGHSPLIEAGGTDATGIERVPDMPALAHPTVMSAWRPVAFRAPDARSGWVVGGCLLDIDFGVLG
jgi:hypothetical protein